MSAVGRRWRMQLVLGSWLEATRGAQKGRDGATRAIVLLRATFR